MKGDKKELLFEINGVKIFKGAIYVCKHKEDLDAPTGFQEIGATKLPSDGVDSIFPCNYHRISETEGVWDTGFFEYSPCYRNDDPEVVEKKIELLEKNLVKPYEKLSGKEGTLNHKNDDFWNGKMFKVFHDKVFDTKNPTDLLTLYFGLLTYELTPDGEQGDARYNESAFVLIDKTKDMKKTDERSSKFFKAIGIFEHMLATDKPGLIDMMGYQNMTVEKGIDDDTFRSMIRQHFEDHVSGKNVDMFLMVAEDVQDELGRAKIEIFGKLKEALKRGNKVTKNPNGVLFYGDTEIGPDLKAAAQNIAKQKDLKVIKKELLFEEELTNED